MHADVCSYGGYIYAVPMNSSKELLKALNILAKKVVVHEAEIADSH